MVQKHQSFLTKSLIISFLHLIKYQEVSLFLMCHLSSLRNMEVLGVDYSVVRRNNENWGMMSGEQVKIKSQVEYQGIHQKRLFRRQNGRQQSTIKRGMPVLLYCQMFFTLSPHISHPGGPLWDSRTTLTCYPQKTAKQEVLCIKIWQQYVIVYSSS